MTGIRDSKKRNVFEALYEASISLFEAKGYDSVTVTEITRAAGVAKGTFFNHFPAKADILAEWYRRLVAAAIAPPEAAQAPTLTAAALKTCRRTISLCEATPELWKATTRLSPTTPAIQIVEAQSDDAVRNAFEGLVDRAKANGDLPDETDSPAIADLMLTLFTGTVRQCVVTGQREHILRDLEIRFRAIEHLAAGARLPRAASKPKK
ncbi:MAG: TetR/AcrR family transcriptional regulator [Hyphomonas sp.]|uniref:TetR/AcrR family transcriptional regulator n=1 Tax=Hyphomonas sp. TaxID=87 RepID=UPI003529391E